MPTDYPTADCILFSECLIVRTNMLIKPAITVILFSWAETVYLRKRLRKNLLAILIEYRILEFFEQETPTNALSASLHSDGSILFTSSKDSQTKFHD